MYPFGHHGVVPEEDIKDTLAGTGYGVGSKVPCSCKKKMTRAIYNTNGNFGQAGFNFTMLIQTTTTLLLLLLLLQQNSNNNTHLRMPPINY